MANQTINKVQINGNPETYDVEDTQARQDILDLTQKTSKLKEDLVNLKDGGITPSMTNFVTETVMIGTNKFDKATMYTEGKWYYYKSGTNNTVVELQDVASYQSLTIPVEQGKTYTLWTDYQHFSNIYSYVFTDENLNIITDGIGTKQTFGSNGIQYTVPEGAKYLLLSSTNFKIVLVTYGDSYHLQLNEGDVPLPYEEYEQYTK